jgi:NitT/TauT family transport system substrate-binding protein
VNIQKLLFRLTIYLISFLLIGGCTLSQKSIYTQESQSFVNNTPFRFGFSNWPGFMPWPVADEEEIFESNKVNIDLKFYDYLSSIKQMQEGNLDANNQSLNDTISTIASGNTPDQAIVLITDISQGGDQVIVREGINKITDLKGKKIATEVGSVDHFLLLLGLKKAGLAPKEVKILNQDMREAVASFLEGQIDGVSVYIPFTQESLTLPGSKVLFSSKDFPGYIIDHVSVTRKMIKENPEAVQALVNSWFDTLKFIEKNPEKSYKQMAEQSGITVKQFQENESQFKLFDFRENLVFFESGFAGKKISEIAEEMNQFLFENKIIEKKATIPKLFDDRFIKNYGKSHA